MKNAINLLLVCGLATPSTGWGLADGATGTPKKTTSSPSLADSSSDSGKQEGSSAVMNNAGGVMLMAMGAHEASQENYGLASVYFGMGALAFMQAREMSKAAKKSKGTYGRINSKLDGDTDTDGDGDGTGDPSTDLDPASASNLKASLKTAAANGIKVDLKNGQVTGPDGKVLKPSDLASADAMRRAGMSADDIMKAQKAIDQVSKDAQKKAGYANYSFAEDEGGGGGKSGSKGDQNISISGGGLGAKGGADSKRDPAQVAGMTKLFNGEPIGVASDSLFDMIERRYKLKDKQDYFLKEAK